MKIQNYTPDLFVTTPDRETFLAKVVNPYEFTTDFIFNSASEMQFKVQKKVYDTDSEKWIYNPCYDYLSKHMPIYSFDNTDKYYFRSMGLNTNYNLADVTQNNRSENSINYPSSTFNVNIANAKLQNEVKLFDLCNNEGYVWQQYCKLKRSPLCSGFVNAEGMSDYQQYYTLKEFIPVTNGDVLFLRCNTSDGTVCFKYRVELYTEAHEDCFVDVITHNDVEYTYYNPSIRIIINNSDLPNGQGYIRISIFSPLTKDGVFYVPSVNDWTVLYSGERRCKSLTSDNTTKNIFIKEQWWIIDSIDEVNEFNNSYKIVNAYAYERTLSDKTFSISESTLPLYIPEKLRSVVTSNNLPYEYCTSTTGTQVTKCGSQQMQRGLINQILDYIPDWSIGYITPSLATKYRKISDIDNVNIYSLLMNTVQSLYQCYVLYDTTAKKINIIDQNDVILMSDIVLSWNNAIKSIEKSNKNPDFVTAMQVHTASDKYGLGLINPTGNNYIYNFSNVKKYLNIVADEEHINKDTNLPYTMLEIIDEWEKQKRALTNQYQDEGKQLVNNTLKKLELEVKLSEIKTNFGSVADRININIINEHGDNATNLISDNPLDSVMISSSDPLYCKLRSFAQAYSNCRSDLNSIIEKIDDSTNKMNNIALILSFNYNRLNEEYISCKKDSKSYSCVLTPKEALLLQSYIYESNWTNENIEFSDTYSANDIVDTLKEVYIEAQKDLDNIYSKPNYEFTVKTPNIFVDENMSEMAKSLYLGNSFTIATENEWIYPVLLSVHMDYDDINNCTLTFSTNYTLKPKDFRFSQLFGTINQTSIETPSFTFSE